MKKLIVLLIALFGVVFYSTQNEVKASSIDDMGAFLVNPRHMIYKAGRSGSISSGTSDYIVWTDSIFIRLQNNNPNYDSMTVLVNLLNIDGSVRQQLHFEHYGASGNTNVTIPLEDNLFGDIFNRENLLHYEVVVFANTFDQYIPQSGSNIIPASVNIMHTRGTITNSRPLDSEYDFFYHDMSPGFGNHGNPYQYPRAQITFGETHLNPGTDDWNHLHFTEDVLSTRYESIYEITNLNQFRGDHDGSRYDPFVMMYYTATWSDDVNDYADYLSYLDDKSVVFYNDAGQVHATIPLRAVYFYNLSNHAQSESFSIVNNSLFQQMAIPLRLNCNGQFNLSRIPAIARHDNFVQANQTSLFLETLALRNVCFPPGTYTAELQGYADPIPARSLLISSDEAPKSLPKPITTFPFDNYKFDLTNPFYDNIFNNLQIYDLSYDSATSMPIFDGTPPTVSTVVSGRTNRNYFQNHEYPRDRVGFIFYYVRTDPWPNGESGTAYPIMEVQRYEIRNPAFIFVNPTDPGTADVDTAFYRFLTAINWDSQAGAIVFTLIPTFIVALALGIMKVPSLFSVIASIVVITVMGIILGFAEWLLIGVGIIAAIGVVMALRGKSMYER